MYLPSSFRIDDSALMTAFMQQHSFACIVTHNGLAPQVTHMPVLFEAVQGTHGRLVSHMARANPQWQDFDNGQELLVVFSGPHAYISPAWYKTHPAVPTWNYTAVHAYGIPKIVRDPNRFIAILDSLVEFYESGRPDRWDGKLPTDYRDHMMKAIVGIEIEITRLENKFKLSQNRPDDIPSVIDALSTSPDPLDRDVAKMMSSQFASR